MARRKYVIKLREPWKTNSQLVSDINVILRERGSKFKIQIGGWNPVKQKKMEKWKIWDFNTGWIVGWRKKDKYLAIFNYMEDVLDAISEGNIGEVVD